MPEYVNKIVVRAEINTNKMTYSMKQTVESCDDAVVELREFFASLEDITGYQGKPTVTQNNAPIGTVATIGHPANKCLVVKTEYGWRYMSGHMDYVDPEEFRGGWDLYDPFKDN